jgi:hypothetical protein
MRTAGVFELFTRRTICFFCPRRVAVNEHAAANADKAFNLRHDAFVPEGCAIARAPRPSMFNAYRLYGRQRPYANHPVAPARHARSACPQMSGADGLGAHNGG